MNTFLSQKTRLMFKKIIFQCLENLLSRERDLDKDWYKERFRFIARVICQIFIDTQVKDTHSFTNKR